MRLLLVTNDYPPRPGGIQQYLGNLAGAWPDAVRVLASAHPRMPPIEERGDVEIRRHHRRFMWPTPGVRRWVERETVLFRPDVVLYGAPYPLPWMGPAVRAWTGVPYAVLNHGAEITIPSVLPGIRSLFVRALRRADVLLANSEFTAGRVSRLAGGKHVAVIGGGVDIHRFRSPAQPDREGDPVVGCVSRFVPRKGQHRLLRAVAEVRRRGLDVRVLLVGTGRMERRLRSLAKDLDVPTRFETAVPWASLPDLYREMDVFCMPCRDRWLGLEVEGLGLVFLEAAATGLPVLVGDSGGALETVEPGATGFVVRSVDDIAEGLQILLNDRGAAAEMGAAGRAMVERRWTWDRVVDRAEQALGGSR